uniref:Cytochrome P450 n=1 Tax=Anopheles dirus TaxID=7168 RepID=A0A182NMT2_9DIPT
MMVQNMENIVQDGPKSVSIHPIVGKCTLELVCNTTMGCDVLEQPGKDTFLESVEWLVQSDELIVIEKAKSRKQTTNGTIADEDYKTPQIFADKLLSVIHNGNHFADIEVMHNIYTMIITGSETSALQIAHTCLFLEMFPDIQERVYREIMEVVPDPDQDIIMEDLNNFIYMERVIKESLRLAPSGPNVARQTMQDVDIADLRIPKGSLIVLSIFTMHRRKDIWGPDAEMFDPDRFLPERSVGRHAHAFIPFSAGSRNCIGGRYAMLSIKLMLSCILRRFRVRSDLKMGDIKYRFDSTLKPASEYNVWLEKHHPWKTQRKALNPAFNTRILKSFIPVFVQCSKMLVQNMENTVQDGPKSVSIFPFISKCSLEMVCGTTIGCDVLEQPGKDTFLESVEWLVQYHQLKVIEKAKSRQQTTNGTIADEDYKTPQIFADLLLSVIHNGNHFADIEVMHNIFTMIIAGSETSALQIAHTCLFLAMFPDIQERVYREIMEVFPDPDQDIILEDLKNLIYMERVIKESLRLAPSGPNVARQTMQDVDIADLRIPKGSLIVLSIFALHRRKDVWGPDAEMFDPDRFLPERSVGRHAHAFIPFSAGARNCIGGRYAMLGMKVMLSSVLKRFRLRSDMKMEDLKFRFDVTLKLQSEYNVRLEKRIGPFKRFDGWFKIWFGPKLVLGSSHPDIMNAVLSHPACLEKPFFYDFVKLEHGIFAGHYHLWKSQRKALNPAFNTRILNSFIPVFAQCSKMMVQNMENTLHDGPKSVSIFPFISKCTLEMVCGTTIGCDVLEQPGKDSFIENVDRFTKDYMEESERRSSCYRFFESVIAKTKARMQSVHVADGCDDYKRPQIFADQLLSTTHNGNPFSDIEITHNIYSMIAAVRSV